MFAVIGELLIAIFAVGFVFGIATLPFLRKQLQGVNEYLRQIGVK